MKFNTVEVNIQQAFEALVVAFQSRTPVYLDGPSGVGKSSLVAQVAEAVGLNMINPLILSSLEPVDLRGLPSVDKESKITYHARPEFFPAPNDPPCLLFLDELPNADSRLHAPCYELVLEGRIGPHKLPPGSWVIAAGNTSSDDAVLYDLPGPLLKRLTVIRVRPDADTWLQYAEKTGIDVSIRTLIKKMPQLIDGCFLDNVKDDDIKPCPRSWTQCSDIIKSTDNEHVLCVLMSGKIGSYAFSCYEEVRKELKNLHPPEFYIEKAKQNKIEECLPSDGAVLYALCDSLIAYCSGRNVLEKVGDLGLVLRAFLTYKQTSTLLPLKETATVMLTKILDKYQNDKSGMRAKIINIPIFQQIVKLADPTK